MSKDASSLRAARQNRIASRDNTDESTQSYKFVQEKVAEKKADMPEVLVASVLDPKSISKTAEISLHLFNKDSQDPNWLICASGMPVAQIRLSDQDEPDQIGKIFTTEQYANSIIESAKKLDMPELLSGVKARPFIASVESAEAFKVMKDSLGADATDQLRKARANLRNDMINVLNLVVNAQTKNFLSENSLKDATFRKMREAGIEADRALAIVEASWQESASKYFEDTFKQASKWMDLSPEAFVEVKEQIGETPNRIPMIPAETVDPRVPRQASNIPLVTSSVGTAEELSEKEQMRAKLGFRKATR